MIAEQYGATLYYIQGSKNIVADALSQLGLQPSSKSEPDLEVKESPAMRLLAEAFAITPTEEQPSSPKNLKQRKFSQLFTDTRANPEELPEMAFPLSFKILAQEHQKD